MIWVVLIVVGLCLGSFVNALVWRLHQQEKESPVTSHRPPAGASKHATGDMRLKAGDYSILTGRSMCPDCHHELAARDLVPVLSWLTLHGRCRYCHRPISWQYPLVEALTAALFVLSYLWWPLPLQGQALFDFVVWLIMLVMFVALAVYDLRWFLLPDRIVYPLTGLAIVKVVIDTVVFSGGVSGIIHALLGVLCLAGLFYALYVASHGQWIGFGDVKLSVALGLLVGGLLASFLVIFAASVFGSLAVIPLAVQGRAHVRTRIPFGPFLLLAVALTVLLGGPIIDWYRQLFLPV